MDTICGEETAAAFARDGVACVRSVLDPGEVAVAAAGIDAVLASPPPLAHLAAVRWPGRPATRRGIDGSPAVPGSLASLTPVIPSGKHLRPAVPYLQPAE